MTFTPTLSVQFAFGFGPYDEPVVGTADWVDVTDDVYQVTVSRGRSSEFEDFPASTCTIGLFNDERQYDPLNTAGTYYGELVANVPVQVRATVGISTFTVWRGLVDGWPATYTEAGFRAEIQVACTDAFKILAERPMPDTFRSFLQTFGAPETWYRCDSVSAGLLNDGTIGRTGVIRSTVEAVEGIATPSTGAVLCPPLEQVVAFETAWPIETPIYDDALDNWTAGAEWSVAAVVQLIDPGGDDGRMVFESVDATGTSLVFLRLSNIQGIAGGDYVDLFIQAGAPTVFASTPTSGIFDGQPHRLVAVRDTTEARIYIDGQPVASAANGSLTGAVDFSGGHHQIGSTRGFIETTCGIVIDELMAWAGRALDDAEVASLDSELTIGFGDLQLSGSAIDAVLDEIGWPSSLRQIDTGEVLIQPPYNPAGMSTLALLQNITRSEGGRLFIDRVGRVTFHDRSRFLDAAVENTVQYTFSDQDRDDPIPPDVGLLDGTLSITVDDRITYDAAEITRVGGITQTSSLSATPARTYSATDLLLPTDAQALSLADWIVFRYGTAQPRSDTWQIDPEIRPADWDNILGFEIGHRVAHDLTPGGIGSSINLEQHLSVIGHDITPEQWIITLNGTPVDPKEDTYFIWAATETADDDNGWGDPDGTPPGGYWG